MGAALWASDRWVFGGWAVETRLAIQVALGVVIYAAMVRLFRLQAWVEVAHILLARGGGGSRLLRWATRQEAHADP
jgi:hypothetical protein